MGIVMSTLYSLYENFGGSSNPSRILMLGLDGAGKTTILYKVKLNEVVCTIPTIGFNVETVSPVKGVTFTVWDVGSQWTLHKLGRHYFVNSEGLFYIVDSADRVRMADGQSELYAILESADMAGVPVVIIANKQDLPDAMSTSEIADKLKLGNLKGHKWHIQGACATTGDGIWEAMASMSELVKDFNKSKAT